MFRDVLHRGRVEKLGCAQSNLCLAGNKHSSATRPERSSTVADT